MWFLKPTCVLPLPGLAIPYPHPQAWPHGPVHGLWSPGPTGCFPGGLGEEPTLTERLIVCATGGQHGAAQPAAQVERGPSWVVGGCSRAGDPCLRGTPRTPAPNIYLLLFRLSILRWDSYPVSRFILPGGSPVVSNMLAPLAPHR